MANGQLKDVFDLLRFLSFVPNRPAAIATVVRTQGSTPQVVGAKLLVVEEAEGDRHKAAGTLGGGCVEADAILASREVLSAGGRSLRAYALTEDSGVEHRSRVRRDDVDPGGARGRRARAGRP